MNKLLFEPTGHHAADLLQHSPLGFISSKLYSDYAFVELPFGKGGRGAEDIISIVRIKKQLKLRKMRSEEHCGQAI